MKSMTKKDLQRRLGFGFDNPYGQRAWGVILEAFCATLTEILAEGRSVQLPGIGTLRPVTLPPSERFCPLTGQVEAVPARESVKFRPSVVIKRKLNEEEK